MAFTEIKILPLRVFLLLGYCMALLCIAVAAPFMFIGMFIKSTCDKFTNKLLGKKGVENDTGTTRPTTTEGERIFH